MEFNLIPMESDQQASAYQQHRSDRAGKARHSEQVLIAGYESGLRDPGAWHHIGQHMRADAAPVSKRPRWLGRSNRHTDRHTDRLIGVRLVIAIAFIATAVIVINTFPAGHP
jgi:hypothetical protein